MTDVTFRGVSMEGIVIPFTLKETNNGRWQQVRGGREAGMMWKAKREKGLSGHIWQWTWSIWIALVWGLHNTKVTHAVFMLPYISLHTVSVSLCVYTVSVCLDFLGLLSLGMAWKTASRTGAEWGLAAHGALWESEDRNRHTHTHRVDRSFRLCFLLNGFKTPVERPLFH